MTELVGSDRAEQNECRSVQARTSVFRALSCQSAPDVSATADKKAPAAHRGASFRRRTHGSRSGPATAAPAVACRSRSRLPLVDVLEQPRRGKRLGVIVNYNTSHGR